jgi:hypothetical protein
MNNVNSISQMNSVVCGEHSSLMGHEVKKGPMMGAEKGPDGNWLLINRCVILLNDGSYSFR